VPSPEPMGALFHESLYVLLTPHLGQIKAAAESAGMPMQHLHEGIVYAMAPHTRLGSSTMPGCGYVPLSVGSCR
jgi:hypothetical protein